jgi:hypothetical protein
MPIYLSDTDQLENYLATLWPHSRRFHCTEPGMSMSLTVFLTLASMRSMIASDQIIDQIKSYWAPSLPSFTRTELSNLKKHSY